MVSLSSHHWAYTPPIVPVGYKDKIKYYNSPWADVQIYSIASTPLIYFGILRHCCDTIQGIVLANFVDTTVQNSVLYIFPTIIIIQDTTCHKLMGLIFQFFIETVSLPLKIIILGPVMLDNQPGISPL